MNASLDTMRKVNWTIALIIALGAVVRFWGIDFGLPNTGCRPDEPTIVDYAMRMFSGDLLPHFYKYPTLFTYCAAACYLLLFCAGYVFGWYAHVSDLVHQYLADPTVFYLVVRCLSAGLGTATILVVYKVARHSFDRTTAVVSSLFMSLAYLHVRESHFGVTDVPMTFLVMLTLLLTVRRQRLRASWTRLWPCRLDKIQRRPSHCAHDRSALVQHARRECPASNRRR